MSTFVVETYLYGDIAVSTSETEIVAAYTDEPSSTASIRRVGERTRKNPIGTRTGSALESSLDGRAVLLTPGSARALKRCYRVRIEFDDRLLTLAARTVTESRLLDGATDNGDNAFGELTRTHDGIDITWAVPFRLMKKTIDPPIPTRDDVLVGVCAAAAFGTGGLSMTTILMGFVDAALA